MKTSLVIADSENYKFNNFRLSNIGAASKLFKYDFGKGSKFKIGDTNFTVKDITIDGFYEEYPISEIEDGFNEKINCSIWLYCINDNPKFWDDLDSQDVLGQILKNHD